MLKANYLLAFGVSPTEYDELLTTTTGRTTIRDNALARWAPDQDDIFGRISFRAIHSTAREEERDGRDPGPTGSSGKPLGRLALTPLSINEVRELVREFVEALQGKKGPVFLLTSALAIYSMIQMVREAVPEEFTTDDIRALLELELADILEGIPGLEDFSLQQIFDLVLEIATDPQVILGLILRFLLPSFGWAATLYEIIDNFDYIKKSSNSHSTSSRMMKRSAKSSRRSTTCWKAHWLGRVVWLRWCRRATATGLS